MSLFMPPHKALIVLVMLGVVLTQSMAMAFDAHAATQVPSQTDRHHQQQSATTVGSTSQVPTSDYCDYCAQCVQHGSYTGLIADYTLAEIMSSTEPASAVVSIYPAIHPDTPYRPPIA